YSRRPLSPPKAASLDGFSPAESRHAVGGRSGGGPAPLPLKAEGALDVVELGGALPGELLLGAPEVAVGSRALVDRLAQVEVADDRRRAQVEDLLDGAADLQRVDGLGAEGLDHHRDRPGDADGIR